MKKLITKIARYNLWGGKTFKAGFKRDLYLSRIQNYVGNKLIKVLVGQRRVGKSYILRQIMADLVDTHGVNPNNIFYLNKEFLAFDKIETSKQLQELFEYYEDNISQEGKIYIFIDEIQNIDKWELFINSYSQDYTREYELFISGSNSTLLSGELSSLLSGRYVEFQILPFSLAEYVSYYKLTNSRDTFMKYIQSSGLPELDNLKNKESKVNYMFSLKNTIILRDIMYRYSIKDPVLLEELFNFVTSNIGHLTSVSSIIKYYKGRQKRTNFETISNYLNYLKQSFIIHEVERYNIRGKQNLGGEKKYFLNDLGFKNYLQGTFPTDIGNLLENFVYISLLRKGFEVSVGIWNKNEIDFVATKGDKVIYVQVAYLLKEQATIDREFGNLLKIKDNFDKYVVTMDDVDYSDYKGIMHIKPWELDNRI